MSDDFYSKMMDRYGYRPDPSLTESAREIGWFEHVAKQGYDPTTGQRDKAALEAYALKRRTSR